MPESGRNPAGISQPRHVAAEGYPIPDWSKGSKSPNQAKTFPIRLVCSRVAQKQTKLAKLVKTGHFWSFLVPPLEFTNGTSKSPKRTKSDISGKNT